MPRKRSIERITYYDPPERVLNQILTGPGWDYHYNRDLFRIRDLALITCLYVASARVTEVVGGPVQITLREGDLDIVRGEILEVEEIKTKDPEGEPLTVYKTKQELPPITRDQFILEESEIWLRDLPIIKQKFTKIGSSWVPVKTPADYPTRIEIPFFRDYEPIKPFTEILQTYLETLPEGAPLFRFGRVRAHQIISTYGQFPHYYRDMGLKFWKRYFNNDSFKLKKFSGHKRWDSLAKYMGEELF